MKIKYSKDSLKFLDKQPKKFVARIREAVSGLTLNPPQGNILLMKSYSGGRKRLKAGGIRIVFRYEDVDTVKIIEIGYRGDIYKVGGDLHGKYSDERCKDGRDFAAG